MALDNCYSSNPNLDISEVYVGIAGHHIKSLQTRGDIVRQNTEEEITRKEIDQLVADQYKTYIPAGDQIIDVIPQEFTVDNFQNIPNPIGTYSGETTQVDYTVTATATNGCTGADGIVVKIFKTLPDIFVPSGFTPGLNIDNIFRPILVGISSLDFFRVYNRYGQLVYSTSSTEEGWDGTVNGKPQPTEAYVWMVQGKTYLGQTIFKKGTVVLMR